jgi:hypothetical protein
MLCKYYVFENNVRETKYMTGSSRREIEQHLMMIKMADQLGGYQLFPYKDYKEYMSKSSVDWTNDEIYSWWDKEAMITKRDLMKTLDSKHGEAVPPRIVRDNPNELLWNNEAHNLTAYTRLKEVVGIKKTNFNELFDKERK